MFISREDHVDPKRWDIEGKLAIISSYHLFQKLHHKQQPFHALNPPLVFMVRNSDVKNKFEVRWTKWFLLEKKMVLGFAST
jgi:hypothetical protein